jgi:creatinine amidohydrolase
MGNRGILLEELTWLKAEEILSTESVVVLPIGAAAKEHGPHLRLANDWILAEYLKMRVIADAEVVVLPTLAYYHYPAFLEYPGSISLECETARDMTIQICRSLAAYGPRRFYGLNTGISTLRALEPAAATLAGDRVLLRYTNVLESARSTERRLAEQEGGTHADELETSMMLYIAPETVDMSLAVKDYHPGGRGLTRKRHSEGTYSPTGIFGDATLATREKGEILTEALVAGILSEIEDLRRAPPPD